MTAPTAAVPLSVECTMARDENAAELHAWCRSAKDVLLPGARPYEPPLIRAFCRCSCHGSAPATPADRR